MSLVRLIRLALRAIENSKLRTLLTMLGVIIGVASVITMLAIGQGSKRSIQQTIAKMGTNMLFVRPGADMFGPVRGDPGAMQSLTLRDVAAIRRECSSVAAVSPAVEGGGQVVYGSSNWSTQMHGVDLEYFSIRKLEIASGETFTEKDVASAAKVCLLGKTVVDNLFGDGTDPVGRTVRYMKVPFRVVGVLASKGGSTFGQDQDDLILAPYTTVQKRILAITHLNAIYVSAVNEDAAASAIEQVGAVLRREHRLTEDAEDDFNVRSQQELISVFGSTTQLLTVLLAAIAGISLLVGGIGIMNIMYVSVTERTREIGLRKAVGAREVDIMAQFLIEAMLISVAGGLVGAGLGLAGAFGVHLALGWPIWVTGYSIVLSFAVCVCTGVFFGWYPARKASRLNPIDALRYE